MYSDIATVRKDAVTVGIGTVHYDPTLGWSIQIDTAIRGSTGKQLIKSAPNESIALSDGDRVVAFIDGSTQLRWVGKRVAGPSIENGVLHLEGFFNFNAHIVSPSMMTLAQLKSLLSAGTLSQTFAVTLAFPDGKGGYKPSSKHFNLIHDPIARKSAVAGFSAVCLDLSDAHGFDWGTPSLRFDDTCPRKSGNGPSRQMTLEGKPTGVDASGNIMLELDPRRPIMTEPEYDAFLIDPSIASYTTMLKVTVPDGVWQWQVDGTLLDPSGKPHPDDGWSSSFEQKGTLNISKETAKFTGVEITLTQNGNSKPLVPAIDAGLVTSCTMTRKTSVPCTIVHAPSVLVKK